MFEEAIKRLLEGILRHTSISTLRRQDKFKASLCFTASLCCKTKQNNFMKEREHGMEEPNSAERKPARKNSGVREAGKETSSLRARMWTAG